MGLCDAVEYFSEVGVHVVASWGIFPYFHKWLEPELHVILGGPFVIRKEHEEVGESFPHLSSAWHNHTFEGVPYFASGLFAREFLESLTED